MNDSSRGARRSLVLEWTEGGLIPAPRIAEALVVAGVTPTVHEWRRFLDRLLLWSGATFLASAVIFFLAFNWNDLGRYPKFALVEILIALSIAAYWRLGADRTPAKATLLFASLLMGALLALFGQTYQTGADTFELFGTWALLIFPWVLIGRFAALWLGWIVLLNLAIEFYFQIFTGPFGFLFNLQQQLWWLFAFNTAALAAWELAARRITWLDERWAARLLALASGGLITSLVLWAVFDGGGARYSWLGYAAWLAAAYAIYRSRVPDLFMLATACLSIIVVVTARLSKEMFERAEGSEFYLLIGLVVIGMSGAAAAWLRTVAAKQHA